MSTRSTFTAMAIALVAASFTGMAISAEPKEGPAVSFPSPPPVKTSGK